MRAINEAAGTDLDFGEEDVIPKDAVPAAITAVGQCVPPAASPEFEAFRERLLGILRTAAGRQCSVAFFC